MEGEPLKYYMIVINDHIHYYLRKNFQIIEGQLDEKWKSFNVYGLCYRLNNLFQKNINVKLYEHTCLECNEYGCRNYDITKGYQIKSFTVDFENIFRNNEYTEKEYRFVLLFYDNEPEVINIFFNDKLYAEMYINYIYTSSENDYRNISHVKFYN